MTYGTKNGTVAVKAISAVLFLVFVFCYLYFYQADILAVSQHVLSGGKTSYEPTIGAASSLWCCICFRSVCMRLPSWRVGRMR